MRTEIQSYVMFCTVAAYINKLMVICVGQAESVFLTELSRHWDLVHAGLALGVVVRIVRGQNGAVGPRRPAPTRSWRKQTSPHSVWMHYNIQDTSFISFYARFTDQFNMSISCRYLFLVLMHFKFKLNVLDYFWYASHNYSRINSLY